jgi:hypothetical protein
VYEGNNYFTFRNIKVAGIEAGNQVPMDLYPVVDHDSGFGLYRGS